MAASAALQDSQRIRILLKAPGEVNQGMILQTKALEYDCNKEFELVGITSKRE
jgi:hypothetical protein